MTEKQKKLVEDNYALIYSLLKQYSLDPEEYYDVAAIGLCKAAVSYDTARGTNFCTFAYCVIRNDLFQALRKDKLSQLCVSLDADLGLEDAMTLHEVLPAPLNVEDTVLTSLSVLTMLEKLPNERDKKIFILICKGYTQNYIAQQVGIAQSMVSRVYKRLRVMIQKGNL